MTSCCACGETAKRVCQVITARAVNHGTIIVLYCFRALLMHELPINSYCCD